MVSSHNFSFSFLLFFSKSVKILFLAKRFLYILQQLSVTVLFVAFTLSLTWLTTKAYDKHPCSLTVHKALIIAHFYACIYFVSFTSFTQLSMWIF